MTDLLSRKVHSITYDVLPLLQSELHRCLRTMSDKSKSPQHIASVLGEVATQFRMAGDILELLYMNETSEWPDEDPVD